MWEGIIDFATSASGGGTAVLIAGLGARMEFIRKAITKVIIEGSEDVKHERALKIFESSFDAFTRCGGFETRKIQSDPSLVGKPLDVAYQFNAKWNDEWTRMLRSVSGATYKKKFSLESFVHSALPKWTEKQEFILECLLEQMANPNGGGKISSLENELLSFKHELEYGSENWLNHGFLFGQESAPTKKLIFKKPIVEEEVEVEIYEKPEQAQA